MSRLRSWFVPLVVALAVAAPTLAQAPPTAADLPGSVAASVVAGSTVTLHAVAAPLPSLFRTAATVPDLPGRRLVDTPASTVVTGALPVASDRTNVAMMIVGGAALVIGTLVDGDAGTIIMIGGGTVGLLGLYHYLQ